MAVWLDSGPETSTTLDTNRYERRPTSEDSQTRCPSASPEDSTECFDHFDFEDHRKPPKRSETYPFVPPSPSKAHVLKPGTASKAYPTTRKRRVMAPILNSVVPTEFNLEGAPRIRHASTIDTNNSASFDDTAVWDQKAILSLDGGGIRGYSALLILQELMRVIGRIERQYASGTSEAEGPAASSYHPLVPLSTSTNIRSKAKKDCIKTESSPWNIRSKAKKDCIKTESSPWLPCHYFDYIAGTSTGGLIGIMLGRLRMNVDDCIAEYETLGAQVFGHSRKCHIRSPLFWPRDKYNVKVLENVVRDVVRRRVPKVAEFPGGRNFAFDENRCRTVVVAFQQQSKAGAEKPYLFRTYKNLHKSEDPEEQKLDRNPDMAHDIPIWQVARATSAAPTYFKPPVIDGLEYLDGGFGANNPCAEIYEEVRKMNNNSQSCVSIILSIGTGKNNEARRVKGTGLQRYLNYLNFARKWASDSEQTHSEMVKAKGKDHFNYFRLNVGEGLDLMKLDEWRARSSARTKIGEWIANFRSFSCEDRHKGNKTSGVGSQGAGVLTEKRDHLQNGNGAMNVNGNGDMDHMDRQALNEPSRQVADLRNVLDAINNASTAHLEDLMDESTTKAGPLTEDAKIPPWFQPKNRTLTSIRKYTQEYLSQSTTIEWIDQCAKLLVEGRRGRAKSDPQRWERACFGTWYQCRIPECPRGEKEYEMRGQLRKHLLDKHKADFTSDVGGQRKLEQKLDSCKIVVY